MTKTLIKNLDLHRRKNSGFVETHIILAIDLDCLRSMHSVRNEKINK